TPIYLNPSYFGDGAALPADFDGEQVIIGTPGDDTIIDASAGATQIYSGDGDDNIEGGAGDDLIDGGDGIDIAVYTGTVSATTNDSGGWSVTGGAGEGTDTL